MDNLTRSKPVNLSLVFPVLIFVIIAGLFLYALTAGDRSTLPSVLVGKAVPEFKLDALEGQTGENKLPGFTNLSLAEGKVSIVNVWASWCGPCHQEHPFLVSLAKESKAPVFGINYKDAPRNALRFLRRYENPYHAIGVDKNGRASIEWGVYGVPETFIVNGKGIIIHKHVGPILSKDAQQKLLNIINKARANS